MEVTLMTEMMSRVDDSEDPDSTAGLHGLDDQLINQLVDRARAGGLQLTGEGGVLQQLTKRLLESALDGEITDHLGYDKHDPAGRNTGNSRNGTRTKTVLTDVGPVPITVPRDRDGSFEPKIVAKRQKRLTGVDEMVISLTAKGLPPGRSRRTWPRSTGPRCPASRSPRSPTRSWRADGAL
jgi:transposase-like protein